MDVSPEELPTLYSWVDGIPLSRPKRNISRDFSDGVLAAEVVAHYCPKLVDLHNYVSANNLAQKISNWTTLNNKVFKRLNLTLTKEVIDAVANSEPQTIERVLKLLKYKIAKYKPNTPRGNTASHEDGIVSKGQNTGRNDASPTNYRSTTKSSQQQRDISPRTEFRQAHNENRNSRSPQRILQASETQDMLSEKIAQKELHIRELQETIELLEAKVAKLEQLVRLKDHKIQFISEKAAGKPTQA